MENYFPGNLKFLLKELGMSQSDLANRLRINPQSVGKWLSKENLPSIENLIIMSDIFQRTIDDMLRKDITKDPPDLPDNKIDEMKKEIRNDLADMLTEMASKFKEG